MIVCGLRCGNVNGANSKSRTFFLILHIAVGVVLLTEVNFQQSWREIGSYPLSLAGLSTIDVGLVNDFNAAYSVGGSTFISPVAAFWQYGLSNLFTDRTKVATVLCSTQSCQSYFFPGGVELVTPDPTLWSNDNNSME